MGIINICIIKLGALGDVVRTTPIIEAIKEKYPNSEITWITKKEAVEILEGNSNINKILELQVKVEETFDILYNFDIEEDATKIALEIKADKKYGYYDNEGFPASFNPSAEYYLNTVFDDDLKKSNRKTYQQMIFEIAELEYKKQKITLFIPESAEQFAEKFLEENELVNKKIIGINIGSSSRWPSKAWSLDNLKKFIIQIDSLDYEIILIGGSNEKQAIDSLSTKLEEQNIKIYSADTSSFLKNLFAIVSICDKILTADSLALHIALALEKPTTALFFVTSPYEIEGYNNLTKLVSPMFDDFFPERSDEYNKELINSISVDQVIEAVVKD